VQLEGVAEPAYARLARWSGLNSRWLGEGMEVFKQERAPALTELPGFSGSFVAVNMTRGRVFALFFWDSLEALRGSEAWERESTTQLESATGPRRRSIFEIYQVAIAPELAEQAS
jgi:heme-degrading monooxygenase HmoA